ncbi:MAG: GNAT family N-acetyltransferase [Anaerolineae bacterium]
MLIRNFAPKDIDQLIEILKANQQFGHPEVDGPEAMLRVSECPAAYFLVAEEDERAVGFIRGFYDGSRAIIYILSVHPDYQRRGIGTALVHEIVRRFKERGARSVAAIVPGDLEFWKKRSFRQTTRIVSAYPIDDVLPNA